jgi:hypothetical protein
MDHYVVFHVDGGTGKNIVATAVCKSIKAAYPDHKLIVVTAWPEVYLHNPNVYRVFRFGNLPYFYEDYIKDRETKVLRLEPYHTEDMLYRRKHLSEIWCDLFQIPCVTKQPELFLTQRELLAASRNIQKEGPILLVQSSGGAENQGHAYSWSRDLSPVFAQEIVNEVKSSFNKVLHIRRENQPSIEGTIPVSDNLRNLFCYVTFADKILGIDSLVQHAAAALKKPATVGWIANSPVVFGHDIHTNILPTENRSFRHFIDSYLEESDWVGGRFHECPYDDVNQIFNKNAFIESVLGSKSSELLFVPQPEIIFS